MLRYSQSAVIAKIGPHHPHWTCWNCPSEQPSCYNLSVYDFNFMYTVQGLSSFTTRASINFFISHFSLQHELWQWRT